MDRPELDLGQLMSLLALRYVIYVDCLKKTAFSHLLSLLDMTIFS